VKAPPYSSLTAFLAHLRALRALTAPSPDQTARRAEMEAAVARLAPTERDGLESTDIAGASRRHRERAERHLIQILRELGSLAG
jgi:hypothetical protein